MDILKCWNAKNEADFESPSWDHLFPESQVYTIFILNPEEVCV